MEELAEQLYAELLRRGESEESARSQVAAAFAGAARQLWNRSPGG
jgi:hypothetical protein